MSKITQSQQKENQFSLQRFFDLMQTCYDNDYDLETYIEMFAELHKLFQKLGRAFAFVTSEFEEKTTVLKNRMQAPPGGSNTNYQKVEPMLDFELKTGLVILISGKETQVKCASGCGTKALSCLHCTFRFVLEILEKLPKLGNASLTSMVKSAYDDTLARFHSWPIRQAVHLACLTLPAREKVLSDITSKNMTREELFELMEKIVTLGWKIYYAIQSFYEQRKVLIKP